MRRRTEDISTGLPLLEAVLTVFIFVCLSGSLITLYFGASRLKDSAELTGRAMILAENAAEALHTQPVDSDDRYMVFTIGDLEFSVMPDGETKAVYGDLGLQILSRTTEGSSGRLLQADISVSDEDGTILETLETSVILD